MPLRPIPDSVTNIGEMAFAACENLNAVTIGTNVMGIGDEAFTWCRSLTSMTMIPASVSSIGFQALDSTSLTGITVNADNAVFSSVDGVLFDKNQVRLIQYPVGRAGGDYTTPDIPNVVMQLPNLTYTATNGIQQRIAHRLTRPIRFTMWGMRTLT